MIFFRDLLFNICEVYKICGIRDIREFFWDPYNVQEFFDSYDTCEIFFTIPKIYELYMIMKKNLIDLWDPEKFCEIYQMLEKFYELYELCKICVEYFYQHGLHAFHVNYWV